MNPKNKLSSKSPVFWLITISLSFLLGAEISSLIFQLLMKLDMAEVWPHTTFLYAYHYGSEKKIQDAILISYLLGFGSVFALLTFFIVPKTASLYGDAKWASKRDIIRAGLTGDDGIILGKFGSSYLVYPGQQFVMVSAPTRRGKGVGIVIPNLLNFPGSAVVLDIKKENFELTSNFRKGHGQSVYLFDPVSENYLTHRWNPLYYISDDPAHRINDIQKIASFLIPEPPPGVDPMWVSESRALFEGIVLFVLDTPDIPSSLGEILRQLNTEIPTNEYFQAIIEQRGEELDPVCLMRLAGFSSKPSKTAEGIKSSLSSSLNLWSNPLIDAATSENDFDFRDLRRRPMTLYLGITPDNLARLAPVINLFIQQLIDVNTRELPGTYDDKGNLLKGNPELKYQVLLLLDEFTAIGKLAVLEKGVSYIAGYNLRLMPIFQSMSQLRGTYGSETAETFEVNHAAKVIFTPSKMSHAEEIAKEIGYVTANKKSLSKKRLSSDHGSETINTEKRHLILPQELKDMPETEAIILLEYCNPIWAKKIKYYEDENFKKRLSGAIEIPRISIIRYEPRGKISQDADIDLENIAFPQDNEKWTDDETDVAADAFFASLMEQSESDIKHKI